MVSVNGRWAVVESRESALHWNKFGGFTDCSLARASQHFSWYAGQTGGDEAYRSITTSRPFTQTFERDRSICARSWARIGLEKGLSNECASQAVRHVIGYTQRPDEHYFLPSAVSYSTEQRLVSLVLAGNLMSFLAAAEYLSRFTWSAHANLAGVETQCMFLQAQVVALARTYVMLVECPSINNGQYIEKDLNQKSIESICFVELFGKKTYIAYHRFA